MPRTRPCAVLPLAVENSPSQTTIAVPSIAAHFMRRIGGAGLRDKLPRGGSFWRRNDAPVRSRAPARRSTAPRSSAPTTSTSSTRERTRVSRSGSARTRARSTASPGLPSPSSRRTPPRSRSSATSTAGTRTAHPLAARRRVGRLGGLRPGRRAGRRLQVPRPSRAWPATASTRPIRSPCAHEMPPRTGSVVWDLDYRWRDDEVDGGRARAAATPSAPISIYEVHLGSWRRVPEEGNRSLTYREAAGALAALRAVDAASRTSSCCRSWSTRSTGSWGYQVHRLLRADQPLRHAAGLHVPRRHAAPGGHRRDPRLGAVALSRRTSTASATSTARTSTSTPTRGRASTPTGRAASSTTAATRSAASCSRRRSSGSTATTPTGCAWTPSPRCSTSTTRARRASGSRTSYGGRENLEAISFLRRLERRGRARRIPDVLTIAEESTAWPMVSRPTLRRRPRLRHEVGPRAG